MSCIAIYPIRSFSCIVRILWLGRELRTWVGEQARSRRGGLRKERVQGQGRGISKSGRGREGSLRACRYGERRGKGARAGKSDKVESASSYPLEFEAAAESEQSSGGQQLRSIRALRRPSGRLFSPTRPALQHRDITHKRRIRVLPCSMLKEETSVSI